MSLEQQLVVWTLLRSRRAVEVVTGPAGTGKTGTLAQANRLWQSADTPVYGAALAAVAARRLEAGSGIPSTSLTRLLGRLDQPHPDGTGTVGLPAGSIVVLDEAGMVGTRQLARLLEHTSRAGGQLILVGDTGQLGEIDAGGLFAAIARRAPSVALQSNQRQQQPWEQLALEQLRHGQVALALHGYYGRGQLHTTDAEDVVETIAVDYVTARATAATPYDVVALAARRVDVADLNTAIRRHLHERDQLGPEVLATGTPETDPLPLAVGDLVVGTRNDPMSGLLNGTRATVTANSPERIALRTDDGQDITLLTVGAADQLAHAYALTVHKAQGLTVDICLVHTDALDQRSGYVAMSRGRQANHLYVGGDATRPLDSLTGLAEQLAASRSQQLAVEQHPYLARRATPAPRRPFELDRLRQTASRDGGRSR